MLLSVNQKVPNSLWIFITWITFDSLLCFSWFQFSSLPWDGNFFIKMWRINEGLCTFWVPSSLRLYKNCAWPLGSASKEAARNSGDLGSIPGLGRSPGEGKGYRLQYSGLGNSMDCIIHGVTKNRIWLSDFHFHFFFFSLNYPTNALFSTQHTSP